MGLDEPPSELETALEDFRVDLSDAANAAEELDYRTPIEALDSFAALADHKEEMMTLMAEHFGVDLSAPQVVKTYTMRNETKVKVIATNNPEVFLGEYTDTAGDTEWAVRPLEVEEYPS